MDACCGRLLSPLTLMISLLFGGVAVAGHANVPDGRDGATSSSNGEARDMWRNRCSGCHVAFRPDLLPAASWIALIDRLPWHFGASVEIAPAARWPIRGFLAAHAADAANSPIGVGVMSRLAAADRPLRVTGTRWFRYRHYGVARATWSHRRVLSPANCGGCHRDADRGIFDELSVDIPG